MPQTDADLIKDLARDLLNEDYYYGSKEDKLKLIQALCDRLNQDLAKETT